MRKISYFLAVFFVSCQLYGLYQSNPATPELIDEGLFLCDDAFVAIRAGYQRDQVFDRKLEAQNGGHGAVGEVTQLYDQGVLTFNFMNRVEIFGSAGAMNVQVTDTQKVSGGLHQLIDQTHNDFTWGIGGRAAIINWCKVVLGASASYQWAGLHTRWNTMDGTPFEASGKIRWSEWQFGIALSYQVDIFYPYIGGNYSRVKAHLSNLSHVSRVPAYPSRFNMVSRDNYGFVVGCDLSTSNFFDIGIEVQMISEQAITLKADIKF